MLTSPITHVGYCSLTGKVRAFTRCVGISDSPATPRRLRRWPALIARMDRLRGTVAREGEPHYIGDSYLRDVTLPRY